MFASMSLSLSLSSSAILSAGLHRKQVEPKPTGVGRLLYKSEIESDLSRKEYIPRLLTDY